MRVNVEQAILNDISVFFHLLLGEIKVLWLALKDFKCALICGASVDHEVRGFSWLLSDVSSSVLLERLLVGVGVLPVDDVVDLR